MIKKLISFCVILSMCVLRVSASETDSLSAECAVVINASTGEVLFEKNAYKRHSMASTTKIMTALLAIESGKLQSEIIVNKEMLCVEGTSMGLQENDSVSLLELVYGLLLASGNDAANVVAMFLAGSLEEFAVLMNARASEIGMTDTNFVTPSGLDSEEHYSTAYDMALLGMEAVKNPMFLSVCSSESATLTYGNPPYLRTLTNHNRLLKSYDFALGIKTGFTKKSGRCLVSYAKNASEELVAVTFNAPDDWNDHRKLLDYGFNKLKSFDVNINLPDCIPIVGSKFDSIGIESETFSVSSCDTVNTSFKVVLKKFIYAPVSEFTVVGYCFYYINGELAEIIPVYTSETIT